MPRIVVTAAGGRPAAVAEDDRHRPRRLRRGNDGATPAAAQAAASKNTSTEVRALPSAMLTRAPVAEDASWRVGGRLAGGRELLDPTGRPALIATGKAAGQVGLGLAEAAPPAALDPPTSSAERCSWVVVVANRKWRDRDYGGV